MPVNLTLQKIEQSVYVNKYMVKTNKMAIFFDLSQSHRGGRRLR
jgi:hypothetical protein